MKFHLPKINRWPCAMLMYTLLHLPVAFSFKSVTKTEKKQLITANTQEIQDENTDSNLYADLQLEALGLSVEAFETALRGYENIKEVRTLKKQNILSIVDFSQPSTNKRLYIIDLFERKVLFHTYVAHGQGSGLLMANKFSNIPESFQSSLGFYETDKPYMGKNGFSLKLKGLERGINHQAENRAIVLHAAPYVSEQFIRNAGYLGRSHGCPAVPEKLNKPIIEKIKDGSILFIYANRAEYAKRSPVLHSNKS